MSDKENPEQGSGEKRPEDQGPGNSSNKGHSDQVKAAIIGATATVVVALISGIFALIQRAPTAPPPPTSVATPAATGPSEPLTLTVAAESDVATMTPQPTATIFAAVAITDTGIAFASRISPDGIALDPGLRFSPDTKTIYVVFRPGRTPPGLQVSHPAPTAEHYYAYLEAAERLTPRSVGWQWYYQDQLVNEYETEMGAGYVWLMVQSRSSSGLFEGILGEVGVYDVYITIAGNPGLHSQLHIEP
jgi:hypothetical protein